MGMQNPKPRIRKKDILRLIDPNPRNSTRSWGPGIGLRPPPFCHDEMESYLQCAALYLKPQGENAPKQQTSRATTGPAAGSAPVQTRESAYNLAMERCAGQMATLKQCENQQSTYEIESGFMLRKELIHGILLFADKPEHIALESQPLPKVPAPDA